MLDVRLHNRLPCWANCAVAVLSLFSVVFVQVCLCLNTHVQEHGIVIIFILTFFISASSVMNKQ